MDLKDCSEPLLVLEVVFDVTNIDVECEALLMAQRYNYRNISAAFKVDSIPITIHLFKATITKDHNDFNSCSGDMEKHKKDLSQTTLGWEKYNVLKNINIIPVDGDHYTMMTDSKNRSLLGQKMTRLLLHCLQK